MVMGRNPGKKQEAGRGLDHGVGSGGGGGCWGPGAVLPGSVAHALALGVSVV